MSTSDQTVPLDPVEDESNPSNHRIRSDDKVPTSQKAAFSVGVGFENFAIQLPTNTLFMPFFNIGLGINPGLLGVILMVFRIWDAITDPIVGNLSDNARTRWGRRRPFIVVGSILAALVFPAIWFAPSPEAHGLTPTLVYLVIIGLTYFVCTSLWSMPYYGLQLEMTPNYDERTRVAAWYTAVGKIASVGMGWVMAIVTGPWFVDAVTGKPDIVRGVQVFSFCLAPLILVFGIIPGLFVKERYYAKETSRQQKVPFLTSLKESLTCKPLWWLILISFCHVFGIYSIGTVRQYVNIYFINNGNLANASVIEGWNYTTMFVTGLLSIPFWAWVAEKTDKRVALALILVVAMIGHLLNLFCLRPDMPYLQLVPQAFYSGASGAIWLILPSMKADVADEDELKTGCRREGSLNAFYSWFIKFALTCSMGVGGLVLNLTGFDVHLDTQPEAVLLRMKACYIAIPIIMWTIGLAMIWFYPLDRKRMNEVRAELERRRGEI
ncbi:MAG: MFS transporter [Akkermansiaceae bacterium]|nr:MFS transporter [Akkermansiaceae bacterium]MCP5546855.1 MFS transporter [Akkermansiaceae bacterium]